MKQLPEILAASAECRKINMTDKGKAPEATELAALQEKYQALVTRPAINDPATLRGNILLHTHLYNKADELPPALRKDLDAMLTKAPELIDGMIEMAWQQRFLDTTLTLIRLHQYVVQGLWVKSSPLQQLPQLTDEEVKTVTAAFPAKEGVLTEFLALTEEDRKKVLSECPRFKAPSGEAKAALADVLTTAKLLPCLEVALDHYVEEEENDAYDLLDEETKADVVKKAASSSAADAPSGKAIHEQDLVTLKVTLRRRHGKGVGQTTPKGTAHRVLAPSFPRSVQEAWWLILIGDVEGRGDQIHAIEKVTDQAEVVEHKLRFLCAYGASPAPYAMRLLVVSDCYLGLDQEHAFSFLVHSQVRLPLALFFFLYLFLYLCPPGFVIAVLSFSPLAPSQSNQKQADLPEYKSHEEDLALDNEPTLFEQVMTQTMDYDSSDDEGEGEGEGGAGEQAKPRPAAAAAAAGNDSDSEED